LQAILRGFFLTGIREVTLEKVWKIQAQIVHIYAKRSFAVTRETILHCNFLRYHFQPFGLNLVLLFVVKLSGEIAERGKRHPTKPNLYYKQASCGIPSLNIVPCASLRYRSARLSPSLMPLTSRRP